ncbi:MAG: hypothetical protein AAGA81_15725 [Acidobacteriota bacterium]
MPLLYVLSLGLTLLFLVLILWDFLSDALETRSRAEHRAATKGVRAHLRPLQSRDRVKARGGLERLRRRAPAKVVARRRTFTDGQTGAPRSVRFPRSRLRR